MPTLSCRLTPLFAVVVSIGLNLCVGAAPVDYGRDVRPILSDKCHTNVI